MSPVKCVEALNIFVAGLVEVVLTAMSVEKTTTTLLKHQVLSLAQLVVYVVFEEAMSTGNLTNANLLLITELSEALMWRLCGPASKTSVAEGMHELGLFACFADVVFQ